MLSQALRAMAGGRPGEAPAWRSDDRSGSTGRRLTVLHVLLIAALIGAVVGIAAGLVVLLV